MIQGRRDLALARTGARLVCADLGKADLELGKIENSKEWASHQRIPIANWEEYRGFLAGRLSPEQFDTVSRVMVALRHLDEVSPAAQMKFGSATDLDPSAVEGFPQFRAELAAAYNALAGIGKLQPVGDRIGTRGDT
jgi:hypothetical protein